MRRRLSLLTSKDWRTYATSVPSGETCGSLAHSSANTSIGENAGFVAAACAVGGVLTLIGLIHGEEVVFFSSEPRLALGYGLAAVVCLAYAALRLPPREVDPLDPVDLEVAAERSAERFEREEERVAVPA